MTPRAGTVTGDGGAGEPPAAAGTGRSGGGDGDDPAIRLPDGELAGWMAAHGAELRAHLARMLEEPDDAEDVLQEVWLTAHRTPPERGPDGNVRAWLYRVATHAALDRLARERRRASLLEARGHEGPGRGSGPPAPDDGLSEADREAIRRKVSDLPRKQRDAVWLRWIEGQPYEVVAEKLDGSVAAARANVYQGLKRLRRDLSPFWSEEMER